MWGREEASFIGMCGYFGAEFLDPDENWDAFEKSLDRSGTPIALPSRLAWTQLMLEVAGGLWPSGEREASRLLQRAFYLLQVGLFLATRSGGSKDWEEKRRPKQ